MLRRFDIYSVITVNLENKSLANISHYTLSSADATNLSWFLSEAPWQPSLVNQTRIEYLLSQTVLLRRPLIVIGT